MQCFIDKDAETIKSFFSEYIIENYPDIDTQIEEAFALLDGEIVSYDNPFSSVSGSKDRKDYGETEIKNGSSYTFEACGDYIFVFDDYTGEMINTIKV